MMLATASPTGVRRATTFRFASTGPRCLCGRGPSGAQVTLDGDAGSVRFVLEDGV
jgi:hypothetical protein